MFKNVLCIFGVAIVVTGCSSTSEQQKATHGAIHDADLTRVDNDESDELPFAAPLVSGSGGSTAPVHTVSLAPSKDAPKVETADRFCEECGAELVRGHLQTCFSHPDYAGSLLPLAIASPGTDTAVEAPSPSPKLDFIADPSMAKIIYRDGSYVRTISLDPYWAAGATIVASIAASGLIIWFILQVFAALRCLVTWGGSTARRFCAGLVEFLADMMELTWDVCCALASAIRNIGLAPVPAPVEQRVSQTRAAPEVTLEDVARSWNQAFGEGQDASTPTPTRT